MSWLTGIGAGLSQITNSNPLGGAETIVRSTADSVAEKGLDAVCAWVLSGTQAALDHVAQILGTATTPELTSAWFSATYLQVTALASLLTLPFLFAAAVQSVLRGDLALLTRSAFVHLPLALLGVAIATPLITLLLSATDEMCDLVSGTGSAGGATLLTRAATFAGATSSLDGSPFFALAVGLVTLAAALALTLELTIREAAIYVVVLMLPLAFAAMVWPARRVWAVRALELLVSLILAKFVIIAVLSLAGAAFNSGSADTLLTAMTLLLLALFSPWALMRLLPFTEVAAAAGGHLRGELPGTLASIGTAVGLAESGREWLASMPGRAEPEPDTGGLDDGVAPVASNAGMQDPVGRDSHGAESDTAAAGGAVAAASHIVGGGGGGIDGSEAGAEGQSPVTGDERLPDFDRIWQAENGAWPEMTLGPDGWAGPTAYEPDASDGLGEAEDGGPGGVVEEEL